MGDFSSSEAYMWYLDITHGTELPQFEHDSQGRVMVVRGEVWCRIPGCHRPFKFTSTAYLRRHVTGQDHLRTIHPTRENGLKVPPTFTENKALITFYNNLRKVVCDGALIPLCSPVSPDADEVLFDMPIDFSIMLRNAKNRRMRAAKSSAATARALPDSTLIAMWSEAPGHVNVDHQAVR
ncbi:hypothetical protein Cob_v012463 [Colletotrichum orbiculare MAFF 240422]|uniref:Uncharacterized protein n=1 Tax=Colletotrichum orbiculare (strain 104-T / ATCC 96160 / CBS 514.97 / LARS 414 / MAFF 240422) TaxID=1213857 RepID=A0A484FAQ3_COLOR|nr:hypothetical protein Cob_v012463 [Colletotrichum orbiculare MAFF 240422]